jgi:hypothetical protein
MPRRPEFRAANEAVDGLIASSLSEAMIRITPRMMMKTRP